MIPQDPKMSIAPTDAAARKPPQESDARAEEPQGVVVIERYVIALAVVALSVGAVVSWREILDSVAWLALWLLLVTIAELLPVMYMHQVNLTLSMPLLLAVAMTLGPVPAGILGFLGSWDQRLIRHEISWTRAFFNRSQIAMACLAAGLVFGALGGEIEHWPDVLLPCVGAVAIDVVINASLVALVVTRSSGQTLSAVARTVVLDSPFLFIFT